MRGLLSFALEGSGVTVCDDSPLASRENNFPLLF